MLRDFTKILGIKILVYQACDICIMKRRETMNENKNSTLSILALIFSVLGCTFLIGLILAIIDLSKGDGRKKTLSIIALVISGIWLIVGIIGAINKKNDTASTSDVITTEAVNDSVDTQSEEKTTEAAEAAENGSEDSAENAEEYYFKDNEIVVKDYTIKITDWKVIPVGEKGNEYGKSPVIAFWYDTTNTSDKEINPTSAWIYIMEAVQDNDPNTVNELNVVSLPDDQFRDTQLQKIKQGGTVSNAVAYELTDEETPVELTAKSSMIGDSIGSMTFDIK